MNDVLTDTLTTTTQPNFILGAFALYSTITFSGEMDYVTVNGDTWSFSEAYGAKTFSDLGFSGTLHSDVSVDAMRIPI